MDATEGVDLASLIDDDAGLDAFERFVASLRRQEDEGRLRLLAFMQRTKDASEFDPLEFADTSVFVKQLEKKTSSRTSWKTAVDYLLRLLSMLEKNVFKLCTPTVKSFTGQ